MSHQQQHHLLTRGRPRRFSIAAASHAVGRRPDSEQILLVQDDPAARGLTQHILRVHGYTVHETHNGMEALDLVRRRAMHIDLLITDIVMPGIDGRELARRLWTTLKDLRVLYVSGYSDKLPSAQQDGQSPFVFLQNRSCRKN
ncbi:response regulator [Nitrospira sp. Nam80]